MPKPRLDPNDPKWVHAREMWVDGYSQADIAEAIEVTQQAVSYAAQRFIEAGDWPDRTLAYDVGD